MSRELSFSDPIMRWYLGTLLAAFFAWVLSGAFPTNKVIATLFGLLVLVVAALSVVIGLMDPNGLLPWPIRAGLR